MGSSARDGRGAVRRRAIPPASDTVEANAPPQAKAIARAIHPSSVIGLTVRARCGVSRPLGARPASVLRNVRKFTNVIREADPTLRTCV